MLPINLLLDFCIIVNQAPQQQLSASLRYIVALTLHSLQGGTSLAVNNQFQAYLHVERLETFTYMTPLCFE